MRNPVENRNGLINEVTSSLWVEFQKAIRTKLLWLSAAAFAFMTLIAGLFMYILKDPERARQLGLVGAKAQVFGGTADWASFINLNLILMSVGGLIIFGFIFVWIFGREFSDRTVYDLLSLPTSRLTIVIAKIITAASWSVLLVLLVFILMLGIGAILDLPGWSTATTLNGLKLLSVTGLLITITCTFFSFAASVARGYLAAVGCIFAVLVLGQIITQLGYGEYFPWTVPLLYSGAAEALTGSPPAPLGLISYTLVGIVSCLSILATCLWWRYSDQT
jgi:ABC-2 type transport system permease protein